MVQAELVVRPLKNFGEDGIYSSDQLQCLINRKGDSPSSVIYVGFEYKAR
jgi:hypothetical protein